MITGQKKKFAGNRVLAILALLLLAVVVFGGPGTHLGLWTPLQGFMLSLWGGFFGGLILIGLSLIIIIIIVMSKQSGVGQAALILVVGVIFISPIGYLSLSGGGGVPPIHDITTDMNNPPTFTTLVGKRGKKANSLAYDFRTLPPQQKKAYADIKPLLTTLAPGKAFAKALKVAQGMGWKITGVKAADLRFEATDHTFWFDFADDIVVVIKKTERGSRTDMRSISRVGISDLGTNAKRIRLFQKIFSGKP